MSRLIDWLAPRDRGFAALRRAGRTAIVMPAMFAIGDVVLGNPVIATFAAFGSFSMLLLVDFPGTMSARLQAQSTLTLATGVLICLGTLASRSTPVAVAAMALVAFAVLFSGVVSSVLAGATTPLLLSFILPVSLPGPAASIPDRLAGWGLASAAALVAIELLWPAPVRNPLRSSAISACRALGVRLRSEVDYVMSGRAAAREAEHTAAIAQAEQAIADLRGVFFATPYRPTGLSTAARAVVRLVDECDWLHSIIEHAAPRRDGSPVSRPACAVKLAAATVLDRAAELLDSPRHSPEALASALSELEDRLHELERSAAAGLPEPDGDGAVAAAVISSLDPGFRAQELSFVVSRIAANSALSAAAEKRSWFEQLIGRQPSGLVGRFAAAQERAGAHVERHSLSLHNSLRGAAGLGLAVLVADLSGVQHAFWVVFGTLSVLRSNALSTGQNIVRGMLGTTAGFVVGAVLVAAIGTNTGVLWALLPIAVLLAGLAPAAISFAAGQAAFTLVLLILFNILAPAGWQIGLVRIEDVALGGGVSLLVGLFFWPRGAGAALGDALAEAYVDSAGYLSAAVLFGLGRCDAETEARPAPSTEANRAAAASRRLDDTFRGYLGERGTKPVPLAEVSGLVTGVAGLRLAGDAVLDLWERDTGAAGDRAEARLQLLAASEHIAGWYDEFAASLSGRRSAVPEPLAYDALAGERLASAVSHDLRGEDGRSTDLAVRVIWTGDHLDAARRLQTMLARHATTAVQGRALTRGSPVP
jgi:Fusaric acid resistance protein-like